MNLTLPISTDIVAEYAEFTGKPLDLMRHYTEKGCKLAAACWNSMDGTFAEKAQRFYSEYDKLYIYDHLLAHVNYQFTVNWVEKFLRPHLTKPGMRIVDVGGGIGVHSQWLASEGHYVDHVDIPGRQSEFAIWRWNKMTRKTDHWNFKPLDSWTDTPYDIIFSYATLEHFPVDELTAAVHAWKKRTVPGVGAKQIHWVDPHCGESHPMHRGNGRQEAAAALWNWEYQQPAEHIAPQVWTRRD